MKKTEPEKVLGEKQVVGVFDAFNNNCSNLNLFSEQINIIKLVYAPNFKLVFGNNSII